VGTIPVEYLLVLGCLVSAIVLALSDLGTTFELTQAGELKDTLDAGDRHNYAMLVLGLFAIGALLVAVGAGSKPAAVAVAVAGVAALLIFLIVDLPKANNVGAITEPIFFAEAKAEPAAGFWLSLLGALGLAVSGAALATLEPSQLMLVGRRRPARGSSRTDSTEGGDREGSELESTPSNVEPLHARSSERRSGRSRRPARRREG
jgi:hypothetical protein